jgi:WD repeat and SOF domain-containing protein 1
MAVASSPFREDEEWDDHALNEKRDLDWATVLKRTFEAYIRGEAPNMYGEWISW